MKYSRILVLMVACASLLLGAPVIGQQNTHGVNQPPALGSRSQLLFDQAATGYYTLDACQWDSVYPFEAEICDNFSVPFTASVDSVVWWGGYWNGTPVPPVDFAVKIYADSGGRPRQLPIYSQRVPYIETNLGTYYQYTAVIPPFAASSGVQYWIEFEPTLVYPPQWGNNCSWPANSPGWGDGQMMYFKSAFFGYPQWVQASTVFTDPHESSFQIYGTAGNPPVTWDFETGWQGWTHTNGQAFPDGWAVNEAGLHGGNWTCPNAGDSSLWCDDNDAGAGYQMQDTTLSPILIPDSTTTWLWYGLAYNFRNSGEFLEVGLKRYSGGTWTADPLRTYTADFDPDWDSIDVSAYQGYTYIQIYFYYDDGGNQRNWYTSVDNVSINATIAPGVEEGTSGRAGMNFGFAPGNATHARGKATIAYIIDRPGPVSLKAYDRTGALAGMLVNGERQAGLNSVQWDCARVPAGVYFLTLQTESGIASAKLVVVE